MFRMPTYSFEIKPEVVRENTNLTFAQEQFCLVLLESSDDQLLYNKSAFVPNTVEYADILFTTKDNLSMFVDSDFATTAYFSELNYRGLA